MLRLGSVSYINSLPVDYAMVNGPIAAPCEIVSGVPSALNQKLENNALDISPVSALHYGQNCSDLLMLPQLSISSESGVRSVLLVSRKPIQDLANQVIWVTNEGQTTPVLLKIILELKYGFKSQFKREVFGPEIMHENNDVAASLLIGDNALKALEMYESYYVYDLAEEWRSWTSQPFVFAVWAVRREVANSCVAEVEEIHSALLESKKWGLAHSDRILNEAKKRCDVSLDLLRLYFSRLNYDLNQDGLNSMREYFDLANKVGCTIKNQNFELMNFNVQMN